MKDNLRLIYISGELFKFASNILWAVFKIYK